MPGTAPNPYGGWGYYRCTPQKNFRSHILVIGEIWLPSLSPVLWFRYCINFPKRFIKQREIRFSLQDSKRPKGLRLFDFFPNNWASLEPMPRDWAKSCPTLFLLSKDKVYKDIEAEILPKFKDILRITLSLIFKKKDLLIF